MKAIKVTTEDGNTIVAGYKDAHWVAVEYRIYPKYGDISEYHIHAVAMTSEPKLLYHEWTPDDKSSAIIKLETIETDIVDPPLRNRLGTHKWASDGQVEPVCGFCNQSRSEVESLLKGYSAHICNQCAKSCHETFYQDDEDA